MRRSDREVTELDDIVSIIDKCDVCRVGLFDEECPYILPLNFGYTVADGQITFYFHGAAQGKKYDLIRKNNHVCFEMDCSHRLVLDEAAGRCTMEYESVMGTGTIEFVEERDKEQALDILMGHYIGGKKIRWKLADMPRTTVLKLCVESVTGKRKTEPVK
ncbi:MAG: pyridoxamine 5'-phosphate oxidase family protein [Oscillospiraceae bacterium]|nr:pyridoxamine 5'-phosphate oxidase family protein [Oscillospiraceae bacterium]